MLGAGDAFSRGLPLRLGARRGLRRLRALRQRLRRAGRVAPRLRAGDADARRARLLPRAMPRAIPRPDQDATLTRLHRVTAPRTPRDEVFAFAFDHRNQFFELAQRGGRRRGAAPALKQLFVEAVAETEAALGLRRRVGRAVRRPLRPGRAQRRHRPRLVDRAAGGAARLQSAASSTAAARSARRSSRGRGARREVPGRITIPTTRSSTAWSRKRRSARSTTPCRRAATSCCSRSSRRSTLPRAADTVLRALKRLYNLGIYPEWWKLEPMAPAQWQAIDALIAERDPYCRGVLLLGLSAPRRRAGQGVSRRARRAATCRGFAVGRTIFRRAGARVARRRRSTTRRWWRAVRANFEALIDAWRERAARRSAVDARCTTRPRMTARSA